MGNYIVRRMAITPLLLLGIVTIAFIVARLIPADPLASIVGERNLSNEAVVAAAKARWGLDGGIVEQYFTYLGNLVTGDLGTSFRTKQSVSSDLWERLPATAELALGALVVGGVGGIALGITAARHQNRPVDHVARLVSLVGSSLPVFWLGLIMLYVLYARLGWFPGPGRLPSRTGAPSHVTGMYTIDSLIAGDFGLAWRCLRQLMLPAFVLGWSLMGIVSRLVRAAMLDELHADYVRTARAKGLGEGVVMRSHVLRNALTPVITIMGLSLGVLLTSAVLTETVFTWNGIGSYAVESTKRLDYPAINGVCILGGVIFLFSSLFADVLYAAVDPKIRYT
ncbi:MAG: ABC transporter permease [Acidimicrobiia bacterium]|nr:ABC transporter permease [Acidimicrobiia bacterium]